MVEQLMFRIMYTGQLIMVEQLMFRITYTEQLIWYSSWC